jgi:hypothetical protein
VVGAVVRNIIRGLMAHTLLYVVIEQQHNYTYVIFISKGSRILKISYKTRRAWYYEIINVYTDCCALPRSQSMEYLGLVPGHVVFRHIGGEGY